MGVPAAEEFEMFGKTGFVQHAIRVAAHQEDPPRLDPVVIIENE